MTTAILPPRLLAGRVSARLARPVFLSLRTRRAGPRRQTQMQRQRPKLGPGGKPSGLP